MIRASRYAPNAKLRYTLASLQASDLPASSLGRDAKHMHNWQPFEEADWIYFEVWPLIAQSRFLAPLPRDFFSAPMYVHPTLLYFKCVPQVSFCGFCNDPLLFGLTIFYLFITVCLSLLGAHMLYTARSVSSVFDYVHTYCFQLQ